MCDNCKTVPQILRMLRLRAVEDEDFREPVEVAERRLRCYYECVTKDLAPDDLFGEDEEEDDDWLPEL